jgi:hypothetical protein
MSKKDLKYKTLVGDGAGMGVTPAVPTAPTMEEILGATNYNYNKGAADDYMNQYKNHSFNFNADALYNQYAPQYQKQARMGMEDAIGRAAALTGGYGNSYAQSVGQQAYYNQMDKLNDRILDLYNIAYGRYRDEKSDLLGMANYYNGLAQQDYDNALGILKKLNDSTGNGDGGVTDPLANVSKSVIDLISKYTLNAERAKKLDELITGKVIDEAAAAALASMYNVGGQANFFQTDENNNYELDKNGNLIPNYTAMLNSPELWGAGDDGGINWFWGIDGNAELITPTGQTVTGDDLLDLLLKENMDEDEAREAIRALQVAKGLTGTGWFK